MNETQTTLSERYKHIPGKILPRDDVGFALSCNTDSPLTPAEEQQLQKSLPQQKSGSQSRRRWLKVATNDIDRAGDEMVIDGAMTDNFERNPQFLWQHGLTTEPVHTIGQIVKLVKTATALYALAEYATIDTSPLAELIYRMDTAGLLPANSIGFQPIEWEPNEHGGVRFTKWELIEVSKVELPCNPHAIDDGAPGAPKRLSISEAVRALIP